MNAICEVVQQKETTGTTRNSVISTRYELSHTCAADYSMFDTIYADGYWGTRLDYGPDHYYGNAQWPPPVRHSASGGGSDLGIATQTSLDVLRKTIAKYNITTMIDIPSGDSNWIFDSWETDSLELYIGLDVVTAVVALNTKRFKHHSNKIFRLWNGVTCDLPKYYDRFSDTNSNSKKSVELIHSRDVLQHLPLKDVLKYLCHVFESGAKYFVVTTFPNSAENKDIQSGDYSQINLDIPPFSIPRDDDVYCEDSHPTIEEDKTCVYDLTKSWVNKWIEGKCI